MVRMRESYRAMHLLSLMTCNSVTVRHSLLLFNFCVLSKAVSWIGALWGGIFKSIWRCTVTQSGSPQYHSHRYSWRPQRRKAARQQRSFNISKRQTLIEFWLISFLIDRLWLLSSLWLVCKPCRLDNFDIWCPQIGYLRRIPKCNWELERERRQD